MYSIQHATLPNEQPAVEVRIAPLGRRVAAYLLNGLFSILACLPVLIGSVVLLARSASTSSGALSYPSQITPDIRNWFIIGLVCILIYSASQIWMMSRSGQSWGKRVMNIRVIKTDGTDAGFIGTVLLREVVFSICVSLVAGMVGLFAGLLLGGNTNGIIANLVQSGLYLTCFVMACEPKRDRRTLQDLLADTVVVSLPKK